MSVKQNCTQKNDIILCFIHCYLDGLVQDCSISIANTLEILQSCTKPSTCPQTPLTHWPLMTSYSFWSKLIPVTAWSLMAPSYYLNQCCLIITDVLLHSVQFHRNTLKIPITKMCLKMFIFKITSRASMTQWVNLKTCVNGWAWAIFQLLCLFLWNVWMSYHVFCYSKNVDINYLCCSWDLLFKNGRPCKAHYNQDLWSIILYVFISIEYTWQVVFNWLVENHPLFR